MMEPIRTVWQGCYDDSWKGLIVDEAFAHPAKYARGLIRAIYAHAVERGYLERGDVVVDPFGGVALGALDAMSLGLRWYGVELEPRFVVLGQQNIALWEKYHPATARLVQGDSRNLCAVLGPVLAAGVVGSPPFQVSDARNSGVVPASSGKWKQNRSPESLARIMHDGYGQTPGNLGNLPPGSLGPVLADGVVGSPPYAEQIIRKRNVDDLADVPVTAEQHWGRTTREQTHCCDAYGTTEGQLSNLPAGDGTTNGQLGQESGETFWTASRTILQQCHAILRPGGFAIWVVKAFVRNKAIVDFPNQWRSLCEACGFETIEWIEASLVKEQRHAGLFGEDHVKVTKRASFFRRLAEKKGSPEINHEVVLVTRRVEAQT